ncbi:YkvA family protein [Agrilutibacter solisilvae]|uniref:DUF1232 domain-containing protein n=1 Tax=Agrilutibacter solisilvae TaxID=2763317 RepID=A0A974XWN2_9GAMM|nr:YkvA family protein [Lysobacter solisilvae]QSX77234.1 hypothetical protein I8J32_010560 [Lysobacter solisilvae]
MNAVLIDNNLPQILASNPVVPGPHRRRHIADFVLDAARLDSFNVLLRRLGREEAPLDRDQVATAARQVCRQGNDTPACIAYQLKRATALRRMATDANWNAANDALGIAQLVMEYLDSSGDLIPDQLPSLGRLDDAIVVETAWPQVGEEVAQYLDYRRVRALEARMSPAPRGFRFTREDWEQARHAEVALAAQRERIFTSSYLPTPAGRFFIH